MTWTRTLIGLVERGVQTLKVHVMSLTLARGFAIAIAAVGATGQALLLFHQLADCYPYKMMSTPSAEFYEAIAYRGLVLGPTVSVAAAWWLSRRALWSVPAVACVLSPAAFLALLVSGQVMTFDMGNTNNFDNYTPARVVDLFTNQVMWLVTVGSIVGLLCGTLIAIVSAASKRRVVTP